MKTQNKKGFSLIEMIVMVSIVAFILVIVVNFLIIYARGYEAFQSSSRINVSGITALERMSREIKQAASVDSSASTLESSSGVLKLNTTTVSGDSATVTFSLIGDRVEIKQDGVVLGFLTRKNVSVDNLYFSLSTTTDATIVTTEINIETAYSTTTKSATFTTSNLLRGSY